ncbi:MAG: alkaline phosphatase family protein [Sphingobacteriaceae bacterium]
MKYHPIKHCFSATICLLVILVATSCNKQFDKVVPDSQDGSIVSYKVPKVLYLIADGARGSSVRDAKTPVISELIKNSIYSWNSVSDTTKNDATNWADMMTGVKKEKHGVLTPDFADNKLDDYPVIFKHIKSIKPDFRMVSFAASSAFKDNLTAGADVSESFEGNDVAVKDRLVNFLNSDSASIIVGQFGEIEKVGKQVGFDNKFPGYKAAIVSFDTQVGEILTALKARPTYNKENWLIIVTSNRGGQFKLPVEEDDKTLFSNTNANTFTIFSNQSYKPTFIGRPFLGNTYSGGAVRFKGQNNDAVKAKLDKKVSNEEFNFGGNADFTVSIKVKKGKTVDRSQGDYWYQWPSILGKRDNSAWGVAGWNICLFYNGWRFFGAGGPNNSNGDEVAGMDFSGETWHDLTFVVEKKADGFRYIRMYTDGVKGITNRDGGSTSRPIKTDVRLSGNPNYNNLDPLTLGWVPGDIDGNKGVLNLQMSEFKVWKTALPEAVIQQYACDPTMDESHPYFDYLVGYWPMVEGTGDKFEDKGPFSANFQLQGPYQWENFTDLICSPSNTSVGTLVPKNSDIPTQILSWFNIARQDSWALDGRVWIAN